MNSSPTRGTFHSQCRREDVIKEGRDPDQDEDYLEAVRTENMWMEAVKKREATESWRKNNLEYDLRSTKWVCDKAKASESYAQNIYAALCNRDWQKNDVWPLLKGETYSCSWRYAGGVVADMCETGDYMDWYCSGIQNHASETELAEMTEEQRTKYYWYKDHYVSESCVTDEIREDFFKLGWVPIENTDE